MTDDWYALGQRIRAARVAARMSQQELAAHSLTIGRSGLSDIERGRRTVSALELVELALALQVSVLALLDQEPVHLRGLTRPDQGTCQTAGAPWSAPVRASDRMDEVTCLGCRSWVRDHIGPVAARLFTGWEER